MRIWIVFLAWAVISCNEIEDCEIESSQDFAIVEFLRADTSVRTPKQVGFEYMYESNEEFYLSVVNDTFRITPYQYPDPNDTITNDTTLTEIILPLNPADTVVTYIFETDSVDFELTLSYKKDIEIFYHECPPSFNYTLDSVYSPNYDSVVTVNKSIDRRIEVNVEIYL